MNGAYAAAFVTGMQGEDQKYLKVSSCLKHYAAYSMESGRDSFAAIVTAQDMEDTYLPAFQAGTSLQRGGARRCNAAHCAATLQLSAACCNMVHHVAAR